MWNDERIEQLSALWRADELSAAEIANRIGAVSRNAVIGKARRLGLPNKSAPRKVPLSAFVKPNSAKPKPNSVPNKPKSPKPPKLPVIAYEPIPAADDVARVLSVLDLEFGQCRWPVEHAGGMGYCGCQAIEGKSYCPGHHARSVDRRPPYTGRPTYSHPSLRAFG